MTRWQWLSCGVLCSLVGGIGPAYGCQYNVREVGFVDAGVEPYRLFVYVPPTLPSNELDRLKTALDTAFTDTNVRGEAVCLGTDANSIAARFLSLHHIDSYPADVLVSPDGPSCRLAWPAGDASPAEMVFSLAETALDSPTRRQILEESVDTYGVVLLIEGPQQDRNVAAREAISAARAQIDGQREYLPKPIAKGPAMVVLERSALAREETLLWTLGLTPQEVNEPCAAIFYGRGRWIGPLFRGEGLTDDYLIQVLSLIGADCECGLDYRWMQGTMLPARWDEAIQQKVAASLGFDPESPIVKMEMLSIVRRGVDELGSDPTPGYQEIAVGGAPAGSPSSRISESNDVVPASEMKPVATALASESLTAGESPPLARRGAVILAISFGGLVLMVAALSAVVLFRAKKD